MKLRVKIDERKVWDELFDVDINTKQEDDEFLPNYMVHEDVGMRTENAERFDLGLDDKISTIGC